MDVPFAVTTPMRVASANTLPPFVMPAGACDTHFHVFERGYPAVGTPQYTFPDATLTQYEQMAAVLGIERMVLVQPTYYGDDNTLTLDTLDRLGDRARGVVRVPPDVSPAVLDDYDRRGVRAIRLDLFARRDWSIPELTGYVAAMASLAAPRGWHLQFYAPGPIVLSLVPFLATLEVSYVIDHMGYIKRSDGLGDEGVTRLLSALSTGNCWIKLTGPYRVAADEPMSTLTPLVRALVESHPGRLIWGTDWPHLPDGQRDTGELLALLADWVPDAAVRERILVGSPDQLFYSH